MRELVKLKNITSKIGSGATPKGGQNSYQNEGISLIRSQNVLDFRFSMDGLAFINENQAKDLNNVTVEENDILLNITGDSIARVCIVPKKILPARVNQHVAIIRCNDKVDSEYLFYYLQHLKSYLLKICGVGGTRNALTKEVIEKLDIILFDNQKGRAAVLSALDSKIELNNRINTELEAMAKTLYDYWFVQFDFPDKNGKPYKTSGGKMVWNEELKREIPEGWEVKKIDELLKKNTTKFNFNDGEHDLDTIDLSVMPSATMCLNEKNNSNSFGTNLFKLNKYDILFGAIRPYLLKAGFAPFDGLVTGTVHSFSTQREDDYNFLLLTMTHDSMFKFAISNSKGTKMPVIGADDLLNYKVAYNKEMVKKFNECISFKEIIAHNINVNQKLSELRDWLLPMLMNGQFKVG